MIAYHHYVPDNTNLPGWSDAHLQSLMYHSDFLLTKSGSNGSILKQKQQLSIWQYDKQNNMESSHQEDWDSFPDGS